MSDSEGKEIDYNEEEKLKIYINLIAKCRERLTTFETTLKYFGNISGKSVVDFGCGPGFFLKACSEHGAELIMGIDMSNVMIEIAKSNVPEDQTKSIFIVHDCFQYFQLHYNTFDCATSHFALHYAEDYLHLKIFLTNMYNVLNSGGKCVVVLPNLNYTENEREIVAETFGYLMPPPKDMNQWREPHTFHCSYLKMDKEGIKFSKEISFTFKCVNWSDETVRKAMEEVGFLNIERLEPLLPVGICDTNVMLAAKAFLLILGARKP